MYIKENRNNNADKSVISLTKRVKPNSKRPNERTQKK